MLKEPSEFIIVFIIISVMLILALVLFISLIIYRYQQKQNTYFKDVETLKTSHENTLLQSQLEIQEQTFQNISREIHDNIGQKLSLAKLHLTMFDFNDRPKALHQLNDSVDIMEKAIIDLKNISHSMSNEIILSNGLIKGLEFEVEQLLKSEIYKISFSATGNPVFLNTETELVLFRIIQEVLNNILKHANASVIDINLHYTTDMLAMQVNDNGKGFYLDEKKYGTGLKNIRKRSSILNGNFELNSKPGAGTEIKIKIPINESDKALQNNNGR